MGAPANPPKKFNFILIGLVIFIFVFISFPFLYFSYNFLSNGGSVKGLIQAASIIFGSDKSKINAPTPTVSVPTPTPTDETSTWKTYENNQYGFSVSYPPSSDLVDFSITPEPRSIGLLNIQINLDKNLVNENNYRPEVRIDVWKGKFPPSNTLSPKKIRISGLEGFRENYIDQRNTYNDKLSLYVPQNDTSIVLSLYSDPDDKDIVTKIFDQILSTFKFTNPNVTPVGCTLDAKICPDGTSVGRTGPNCEFAPCPGE